MTFSFYEFENDERFIETSFTIIITNLKSGRKKKKEKEKCMSWSLGCLRYMLLRRIGQVRSFQGYGLSYREVHAKRVQKGINEEILNLANILQYGPNKLV